MKNLVHFIEMSVSLEWIHQSLTEAADDLEQETDIDGNEGVPLVPIAEADILSMEDNLFQKMLVTIGLSKPADEQVS